MALDEFGSPAPGASDSAAGPDLRTPPGVLATHGHRGRAPATPSRQARPAAIDPLRNFAPERLEAGMCTRTTTPETPLGVRAEGFVYDVFRTSGFCAESPRRHVEESEPWRPGSHLHIVLDEDSDEILGVVRTILGSHDQLPVSRFEATVDVPAGLLCEIGSLAVKADLRGLGVANELHRMAFLDGIRHHAAGFCFLVEQWMFDFFGAQYGLPVRALAEPEFFMGGEIVPTGMWLPEMLLVIAECRPLVYEWAVEDLEETLHIELGLPMMVS